MTQPRYAPITEEGEVRPAYRLAPPQPWLPHRAAELRPGVPARSGTGVPGPDQGYALRLAERFVPRLVLQPGEHAEDVIAGAVAVALRRAALFGRAPVSTDLELALGAFGYLSEAEPRLVAARRAAFAGAAHNYLVERRLAGLLSEKQLRSSPEQLAADREAVVVLLERIAASESGSAAVSELEAAG
jgi:hypothetical protein